MFGKLVKDFYKPVLELVARLHSNLQHNPIAVYASGQLLISASGF